MAPGGSNSLIQAANEYFDTLVKSRFIEMFGNEDEIKTKWPAQQFIKCCNVLYGYPLDSSLFNEESDGMPIIRVRDINTGFAGTYSTEAVDQKYIMNKGDLLVSMDGDFRAIFWNDVPAILNQRTCKIECKPIMNKLFLLFVIRNELNRIHLSTSSTTVKHLSAKEINKIILPVPPIELQNQFADFVRQVDKSKLIFQQMVSQFDELVKSRFIEMFSQYFNSNEVILADLCTSIESGKSFNCGDSRNGIEPAILKLGAVLGGVYNPDENKVVDSNLFRKELEVRTGDVLFSRKNTYELVGTAAYVWDTPPNLMLPDLIFRINLKDDVNPIYFVNLINHPQFRIRVTSLAHGAASSMPNISKKELLNLSIPVPSINEQSKFADFVKQVDKSKSEILEGVKRLRI